MRKGAPHVVLRVAGPVLVLLSIAVIATGVAALAAGRSAHWLVDVHKVSFILWFVVMTVHVLGHVLDTPKLAVADYRPAARRGGLRARRRVAASGDRADPGDRAARRVRSRQLRVDGRMAPPHGSLTRATHTRSTRMGRPGQNADMAQINKVKVATFSLSASSPDGDDTPYLEWHQLDHMPEQYQIPGLLFAHRWASTPRVPRAPARCRRSASNRPTTSCTTCSANRSRRRSTSGSRSERTSPRSAGSRTAFPR